uniref:Uncharacterized protein n=1 Tax=Tanacetum cinerariifolium TaxID=118510 RepID=A0A6L2KNW2_TANCI|nr:hypothetical protein [Tanacetum cinerariifolium]
MDTSKKFDLVNPECLNESKILVDILINHPLRLCIEAYASVPWIHIHQFWHTLKIDDTKDKFKFFLDIKKLTLTVVDFRCIFQSPKATKNNNTGFEGLHYTLMHRTTCIPYLRFTKARRGNADSGLDADGGMKLTTHYNMYVVVFRVDVPMIQSQPDESTQGTHRTLSAPKTLNSDTNEGESKTHISIAMQRSLDDLEAQHNVKKVQEHMVDEKIRQLVKGVDNVDTDEFMKEILNTEDKFELKRRENGKGIKDTKDTPPPTPIRSLRTHSAPLSIVKETIQELTMKDDEKVRNADLSIWWSLKIEFEKPTTSVAPCRTVIVHTIDHEDHHDDDAQKPALVYHSFQKDPKAPPVTLLNQDLFYLKYGNLGPKKYTLSLYKYPAIPFPEDDIEEQTSRWKVNLTTLTITFLGIERTKLCTITCKPVISMIYENKKKEKRVMILKEISMFCDATLKRVFVMLKKYNKDVNYGYAGLSPSDADAENLQFYEEYIKDWLKHRSDKTLGNVHEWKTTQFKKGSPRIIDP